MQATPLAITASLQARFPDQILETHAFRGDETVVIRKEAIEPVLRFLRDDPALDFNFLMSLTAVDYVNYPVHHPIRLEVVYHLYSLRHGHRIRVKAPVDHKGHVASVHHLWASADWSERETWEMFGIVFDGHPNLKRLLTHKDFKGHPLLKDYDRKRRQVLLESDTLVDEMEKRLRFKGLKAEIPAEEGTEL
jgi:NADH/F420H2 dehydrogenase subunit C